MPTRIRGTVNSIYNLLFLAWIRWKYIFSQDYYGNLDCGADKQYGSYSFDSRILPACCKPVSNDLQNPNEQQSSSQNKIYNILNTNLTANQYRCQKFFGHSVESK